ncbi:unnamed protein product [Sphagnum jensenii]|uniref:Methyltransferase-like protein 2 n=1 Tax=Sphagnum jensenii TaxID=128206 RepID=A0ABP1BLS3_9BRYO
MQQGIVRITGKNAVFMDSSLVVSAAYSYYCTKSERYYSRSLLFSSCESIVASPPPSPPSSPLDDSCSGSRKRKRKKKKKKRLYTPNEKESFAECRHQEVRGDILEAYEAFQATAIPRVKSHAVALRQILPANTTTIVCQEQEQEQEVDFVELGKLWQAPLYEITFSQSSERSSGQGLRSFTLFNTVIENAIKEEVVAECAGCSFLLPCLCQFLISDINQVHQLVPGSSCEGFNLLVIDPPWENKSVHRRALYPTLPNRSLLSLPVKQLAHADGALVALWITNREKLRQFAEKELFPAWGITPAAVWYWLKVKEDGVMVSPLDLAHHKPYECLLLGYLPCQPPLGTDNKDVHGGTADLKHEKPPDKFVIISVPGDHSRKPPLGPLLSGFLPGPKKVKGIELFARELTAGWTSWGNEPLRFQHLPYFRRKTRTTGEA